MNIEKVECLYPREKRFLLVNKNILGFVNLQSKEEAIRCYKQKVSENSLDEEQMLVEVCFLKPIISKTDYELEDIKDKRPVPCDLGKQIKLKLIETGMTQASLAKMLGIKHTPYLTDIIYGRRVVGKYEAGIKEFLKS